MRVFHDIKQGSNLDLILRGTNGAVNKLADAIGKGLAAVALALSTPEDNSAEVKALTDSLRVEADAFDAVNKSQLDKEKFNG